METDSSSLIPKFDSSIYLKSKSIFPYTNNNNIVSRRNKPLHRDRNLNFIPISAHTHVLITFNYHYYYYQNNLPKHSKAITTSNYFHFHQKFFTPNSGELCSKFALHIYVNQNQLQRQSTQNTLSERVFNVLCFNAKIAIQYRLVQSVLKL